MLFLEVTLMHLIPDKMTPYNRISIKQIMDDILDHPMLQDLPFERAINYAVEFIKIVGMPTAFESKIETIDIENYEGKIPDDCYQVVSLRKEGLPISLNTSTSVFNFKKDSATPIYVIRGNIIHTSFEKGKLEMSYLSIPINKEDGFPTIPEVASYIRALELYIKKKWFTILFDLGKINVSIFNNIKQEYAFAVGQAQTELVRPNLDEMQAFTNMWNTLLPRGNEHLNGFKTLGSREIRKF